MKTTYIKEIEKRASQQLMEPRRTCEVLGKEGKPTAHGTQKNL